MKRCPQCEFIYEDDQSLCDMDGILLVYDSQKLPKRAKSATGSSKSQWKSRVFPAVAAVILATVLGLVYYVSTQPRLVQSSPSAPIMNGGQPTTSVSSTPLAPDVSKAPETTVKDEKPTESSEAPVAVPKEEKKTVKAASSTDQPATKTKAKATSTQKAQSSIQTRKDDSKIESLMKKTGRILKKPFRF
jgi:hypothetical protein